MSRRNALVVGASGVIGHAIVRYLQTQDDWTVAGLTRRRTPDTELDVVSDLTKLRQHGCHEILRTENGLKETLNQLQAARIIPPLTV
jgi:nucleoside-diphosphate-sugar epimerase